VKSYLRYGDDFVLFGSSREELERLRSEVQNFLYRQLHLTFHSRNDVLFPCREGMQFLGCTIFPLTRRLRSASWNRALGRLNIRNLSSYHGLVHAHEESQNRKVFDWHTVSLLEQFDRHS